METQKKFFIKNQKGLRVLFDRVRLVELIEPLLFGLSSSHIDVNEIVTKVESGLNDDMSSTQLMDLLTETVAFKTVSHPDFSILAARIYAKMMHRNTPSDLLEYANNIHSFKDIGDRECKLLSDETYDVFRQHHKSQL